MPNPWYPKADARSQRFDKAYPGGVRNGSLEKFLLHSTEGAGWPSYSGGAAAPTFTALPNFEKRNVAIRQHFPVNMSSRALRNAGSFKTNRDGVVQMECVGTSGWATPRNRRRSYTLPERLFVGNWPDWYLREIANVYRWLHDEWGIPYAIPRNGFFAFNVNGRRMTVSEFDSYKGLLGHQHVPGNDHSDPGALNVSKILSFAKAGTAAKAPNPIKKAVSPSKPSWWGYGRPISYKATMTASSGNRKLLQQMLAAQKKGGVVPYYTGKIDGVFGHEWDAGLRDWRIAVYKTTDPRVVGGSMGFASFKRLVEWGGWKAIA